MPKEEIMKNAMDEFKKIQKYMLLAKKENIDFRDKLLHVRHTLCYFSKGGKYVMERKCV